VQIPILIEPVAGNGYRARGGEPFAVTAEGATRDEALAKLKELWQSRLSNGAELIQMDITAPRHPWMVLDGIYKDDPLFEEWKQAIADYRRKIDEDPDI
jgi:hypothetical protein